MAALSRARLVTFDVTGTLIGLRDSPGVAYKKVADKHCGDLSLDPAALTRSFSKYFKELTSTHPNFGLNNADMDGWSEWWSRLIFKTFRDSCPDIEEAALLDISAELIRFFGTHECWTAYPAAIQIVEMLKVKGIATGVITNSDPRTATILRDLGFPEFDFVLSAYDAKVAKPHRGIFDIALKRAGLGDGGSHHHHHAIHVGNDKRLDFGAANEAGWTGVLVNNNDHPIDCETELRFRNLEQILDVIRRHRIE